MKNQNYVFCGLGQYSQKVQSLFNRLSIFQEKLTGGWYDAEQKALIVEQSAVLKLNSFNKILIKLFLRKEKCFLTCNKFRLSKTGDKNGFTYMQDSKLFIDVINPSFPTLQEL